MNYVCRIIKGLKYEEKVQLYAMKSGLGAISLLRGRRSRLSGPSTAEVGPVWPICSEDLMVRIYCYI